MISPKGRFAGLTLVALLLSSAFAGAQEGASAYDAEKEKALANPYANDLGPDKIDVSSYPADMQKAYKDVLQVKCARCHSSSRPLNSQFFEVDAPKEEKQARLAALKQSAPDMFSPSNKHVWQVETDIWQRYVKRMMAKPGCNISNEEGKAVWKFLVYDSNKRKAGADKAAWKAHREKLLAEFKQKHPEKYKELYP